jgi:GPH family glycoside/pentoside/hexuronide:cation symporter
MFRGFYLFFYVDVLGLAVTLAAIVNVIYAIWDALNDPLVGYLSDNTRTRWGRRRPWLLAGLPFYVSLLVLIYAAPEALQQGHSLFWYALIVVFLFEGAYTVMSVNYCALFPELFQGFEERTHASAIYQGLCTIGELTGFALTPVAYSAFGFLPTAVLFATVAGATLTIAIVRNAEDTNAQRAPILALKDAFGPVLQDRPFWLFAAALTFLTFATGIYVLATPFWVKYTLGAGSQAPSIVFAAFFVAAIGAVPLWSKLLRQWGVQQTWLWSVGIMATSAIALGLASSLAVGVVGGAIAGAGFGGIKVCREMIVANLVDRSLARMGHRREGLYYSLLRVFGRLSKILEALALMLVGVLFGYVSGENPGPNPGDAFRFLITVIPLVFVALAWLIARQLPFAEQA